MCLLFETIKIAGGIPQNLSLHEERMNCSRRKLFGNNDPVKLADCITVPDDLKDQVTRCRVIYSVAVVSTEFSGYIPADIRTLRIVDAGTIAYDHKYLDRSRLTSLIDKNAADDILIVRNGCITDASFANIVFMEGQRWVTPDTPLLRGTMREFLLREGIIGEDRITIDDLPRFTHFRLINAMLGFDAPVLPAANIIRI